METLLNVYNSVVVDYNLIAPKDIPYRSEAIADFVQA